MKKYNVKSTSSNSANISDIILRETSITRLIFRGKLINNPNDENASVKGKFLFQRKSSTNDWEDTKNINLNSLKAGEGVKLSLKSGEVLSLYQELTNLYKIFDEEGIPSGDTKFVKLNEAIKEFGNMSEDEMEKFLRIHSNIGIEALDKIITWAIKIDEPEKIINKLKDLDVNVIERLNSFLGLSKLKSVLEIWNNNKENYDEEFWQSIFKENPFVLSQLFSFPVIIQEDKAYVGGKGLTNTGGNIADFIISNQITTNIAFIEIKTPGTKLIGSEYRNNILNISRDLTGAVAQVLTYSDSLRKEFNSISANVNYYFEAYNPKCIVIAGDASKELDDKHSRKTFELYRSNMKNVIILTYDEVFKRIENLINLFEDN